MYAVGIGEKKMRNQSYNLKVVIHHEILYTPALGRNYDIAEIEEAFSKLLAQHEIELSVKDKIDILCISHREEDAIIKASITFGHTVEIVAPEGTQWVVDYLKDALETDFSYFDSVMYTDAEFNEYLD